MSQTLLIQWQPSYSVGNTVIDRQHRVLIDIINEFYFAFQQGEKQLDLKPVFERLTKYSMVHFALEEIGRGELILNTQIIKTIKNWLVYHILEEDKKYAVYADGKK